jgi:cobyrinic acid a,c-diamide synthase
MKAFVVAAPMTGSGKTTVTLGLLSALRSRGFAVQAFKVGPDFIDPSLHELATLAPSHNLDGWMLSRTANETLFAHATTGKDIAVVEGVMGLFDGVDGKSNSGSTAEMAQWLNLPIVLVIDANPLARSAAAIIEGFRNFDKTLQFAGVIFNRVAGEGHFRILADAVHDFPILGWLPHNPEIEIRERHLGLLTGQEQDAQSRIERIHNFVVSHVDIDRLLRFVPDRSRDDGSPAITVASIKNVRVALARDEAFSFYYHANRMEMERAGATIVEFSPIRDQAMPTADLLYIGGGYPELYRDQLAANISMRASVRDFINAGGRFYAECGGLMYLARRIENAEMVGVLSTDIRMSDRPSDFGYCEVTANHPSLLGPRGTRVRGHQFHHSTCAPPSEKPVYTVRQGSREYQEGFRFKNGIASYVHLHFLSNPDVIRSVLQS